MSIDKFDLLAFDPLMTAEMNCGLDPEARQYARPSEVKRRRNPYLGRFLATDPRMQFSSPYNGMGNNPISLIDPTGMSARGSKRDGISDSERDWNNKYADPSVWGGGLTPSTYGGSFYSGYGMGNGSYGSSSHQNYVSNATFNARANAMLNSTATGYKVQAGNYVTYHIDAIYSDGSVSRDQSNGGGDWQGARELVSDVFDPIIHVGSTIGAALGNGYTQGITGKHPDFRSYRLDKNLKLKQNSRMGASVNQHESLEVIKSTSSVLFDVITIPEGWANPFIDETVKFFTGWGLGEMLDSVLPTVPDPTKPPAPGN